MKSLHGKYYDYKAIIDQKPKIEELQITGEWYKNKWGNVQIECKCSCGNTVYKAFSDLNNKKKKTLSCGCKHKEIVREIGKFNKIYYLNESKIIDSKEMSYVIGLLAADGYVGKTGGIGITLQKPDGYILEKIKEYIEWTGPVKDKKRSKEHYQDKAALHICDSTFRKYCYQNGIIRDKTKKYITIDKYIYDKNYWRGMIDGDGCIFSYIEKKVPKFGITLCGTLQAMESFRSFCSKIIDKEIKVKINKKPGVFYFMLVGEVALKIMNELYSDIDNGFYLTRKYEKYKQILKDYTGKKLCNHIGKYNKDGSELIKIYNSSGIAAKENNIGRGNLIGVCIKNRIDENTYRCKGNVYKYIPRYL